MSDRYQFARANTHPNWTPGSERFGDTWAHAHDLLRFHKGAGFVIQHVEGMDPEPVRRLTEVAEHLEDQLKHAKEDTRFYVKAVTDNFTLLFRRHAVRAMGGELVIEHAKNLIGTPYVFGATDCSWLTLHTYALEGVTLPHNAAMQYEDKQVRHIRRSACRPGDLVFIDGLHHVALYLDEDFGGRVIDTEPHSTGSPAGWPTPTLGVGVRIRPMFLPWYCGQIVGYGRVASINGSV
jgi:cell wall-associated NlpC family hydrolase